MRRKKLLKVCALTSALLMVTNVAGCSHTYFAKRVEDPKTGEKTIRFPIIEDASKIVLFGALSAVAIATGWWPWKDRSKTVEEARREEEQKRLEKGYDNAMRSLEERNKRKGFLP